MSGRKINPIDLSSNFPSSSSLDDGSGDRNGSSRTTQQQQTRNGSNLSFPVTPNSSQDDFLSIEKSSTKSRLIRVFIFGLLLYALDIGLHVVIASQYLDMRECHRGFAHTFNQFSLEDFVNSNSTSLEKNANPFQDSSLSNSSVAKNPFQDNPVSTISANSDTPPASANVSHVPSSSTTTNPLQETSTEKPSANPLQSLVDGQLYFKVRSRLISLVPEHWVSKILAIVDFQLGKYRPSQIAELCTFNGRTFNNAFGVGVYVCENALSLEQQKALNDAFKDVSADNEDRILNALLKRQPEALLAAIPEALGVDVPKEGLDVLKKFTKEMTSKDLSAIMTMLQDEKVSANLVPMLEALGRIKQKDLDILSEAFSRVNKANIPKIDDLLTRLNVSFTGFLTDHSLFAKFLKEPALTKVLMEIQGLLPNFEPNVLNSILEIKDAFDQTAGAGTVLERIFELPLGIMLKIMGVRLAPSELEAMKKLGAVLQSDKVKPLLKVVRELHISPDEGSLRALAGKCHHDRLSVRCEDTSVDLCPHGHLLYGLLTLGALALPGALFALSEFLHFRSFHFGSLFGKAYGKNLPRVLKWVLLPLYVVVMVPLTVVITIAQYYRVLKNIFHQKSPAKIQDYYSEALNLHALEAAGNSFFQIVIQIYFLLLLVSFGAGTFIAGVDASSFFQNVVPLTIISTLVSSFNLAYTSWKLSTFDHQTKSLPLLGPAFGNVLSFFSWFWSVKVAHIISLVLLAMVAWVEMFSDELTSSSAGDHVNATFLPIAVLLLAFPLNVFLHRRFVQEEDAFKTAHGFLSAVFPARYLHRTNKGNTRKYVFLNQFVFWAVHILAWFSYSMVIYSMYGEEAGILRITPFILAIVSFGPFFGAVHWSTAVNPSYSVHASRKDSPDDSLADPPLMDRKYLFYTWQVSTITTRLTSLALLGFVFFDHWSEVGGKFKLALLMMVPYLLLILVVNLGLQIASFGSSVVSALLSSVLPNDFRRSSIGKAGRYIVLNVALNLVLHLILWLTMTFYCWECTKVLDTYFKKLSICFPVAVGFWLANLILTLFTWRLCIRDSLKGEPIHRETFQEHQKTGWPAKVASVTTKF